MGNPSGNQKNVGGRADPFENSHLVIGINAARRELCVCPEHQELIVAELHQEAAFAKERRKAREERAAARPPSK